MKERHSLRGARARERRENFAETDGLEISGPASYPQVVVKENIVAIEFKAMLVVNHNLLDREQTLLKNVVDLPKQFLNLVRKRMEVFFQDSADTEI